MQLSLYIPKDSSGPGEVYSEQWLKYLHLNIPHLHRMPQHLKSKLYSLIVEFIDTKSFEGREGFEITDSVKLVIAAQACILLVGKGLLVFPRLEKVYVYPSGVGRDLTGTRTGRDGSSGLSGYGQISLSWSATLFGASNSYDGDNVVFHEIAHQLDGESGATDGIPILRDNSRYKEWRRVIRTEFEALRQASKADEPTVLDKYGATDIAEFFAVATECFFENPKALAKAHTELYIQLGRYYNLDPAKWE